MKEYPELTPVFAAYEALVGHADAAFAQVAAQYPDYITCTSGCSDCCNAIFDLSLVEAMYLNNAFTQTYGYGPIRSAIVEQAAQTDRTLTRLKRDYFKTLRDAEPSEEIINDVLTQASKARVRCPLLSKEDTCLLYEARPITCRLYGIPLEIGGKAHVCGQASFPAGGNYPTVHINKIQERLDQLSLEIQEKLHSRFRELFRVYVPVSMALLTRYDDTYLGIGPAPKES